MLTNNFRNLMSFYLDNDYKDVLGDTRKGESIFGGIGTNQNYDTTVTGGGIGLINGYQFKGSNRSFNYDANPNTNSFTNEQTTYRWQGVLATIRTSGTGTKYTSQMATGFVLFVGDNNNDESPIAETVADTDWKLRHPVELDVTAAACTSLSSHKTYVSRTFANNTENDVVIKEIGCYIFTEFTQDTNVQPLSKPIVMIGRKVLSNPVTIPVGEQRTFTYVIDMSKLSFEEADGV